MSMASRIVDRSSTADASAPALTVRDLCVGAGRPGHETVVVDGVSFNLPAGGRLALVGESGSGKSMTAMAVTGLLPGRFRILSGEVRIADDRIDPMGPAMTRRRGRDVSVIFQDPMSALNPVMTIGAQLIEAICVDRRLSHADAKKRAIELLDEVQIARAAQRLSAYPHEFSGGMRQRVIIAIALANRPRVLIADEPTTALDVTTQLQILRLLDDLCRLEGAALLLISHDIGLVEGLCDEVCVLYGGRIMERGPVGEVIAHPRHPYSQGLLAAIPPLDETVDWLKPIPGEPTSRIGPTAIGCPFEPRCSRAKSICRTETPSLLTVAEGVRSACHFSGFAPGRADAATSDVS